MDKNTLTGLVLIGAIMFGFFYLNKPKETPREGQESAVATSAGVAQNAQAVAGIDSHLLAQTVRTLGSMSPDSSFHYSSPQMSLTVSQQGQLGGYVVCRNDTVSVADAVAGLNGEAATLLRNFADNSMRYGNLARFVGGQNTDVVLQNNLVEITIGSLGAAVKQVRLKNYKTEVGEEPADVELFRSPTDGYSFAFNTADQRIDTRNLNFEATLEGDSAVVLAIHPTPVSTWAVRYTLSPDNYLLRMDIVQNGMHTFLPGNTSSMEFAWNQKLGRNEKGRTFEERNSAVFYKYVGEGPEDLSSSDNRHKSLNGRVRWVAFKNQFFSSVIVAREPFGSADLNSTVIKNDPTFLKDMSMTAQVPYTVADGTAASFDFYFGPNDYPVLSALDKHLDVGENLDLTRLIPLGWGLFRWINTLIVIPVFTFLKGIGNYGIIILLLTLFIKLIIFPFTFKSFQSQAKMRVLAPEIKKINERYPDQADALKRQQETMALYSRAGASPFSGCLPMLLQMPVLIAMFSFFPSAIELRGQSFLWAHDLSAPDSILTLPFSIPFYGNHVSLFCLLMTAVNIIYIRISMSSQPTSASMPGMKMMQYLMPVMFLFIFNDYASGLSYYYFLSLLITIVQSWAFRRFTNEDKLRAKMAENAKKPRKKSGFMARLEEASRQAQAAQRQQANRRR